MCTAKNDEKEMLAQLVQNATEVKNEENNSLLHYLVVWGYNAGIQLLEIESTWKTTLTNKRNYTPVHFAAYLSRHKFPELLLKKTENVKRSKSLQKLKNRIPGESEEDAKKTNLMRLLEDGEKMREVNVFLNVNEHLVSSLTCGTKSQYEDV